ncbi:MAG: ankyrin repeat domain-containing protein [Ketobacteraceae bacterium]|nr:ankyrin repeat domain-containing protein [Ketobacteraceae bacterium]
MKKTSLLITAALCWSATGCDQSTQESLQEKAHEYVQLQVYETRMNLMLESYRQQVALLKKVHDLASFQQAEADIAALKAQQKEKEAQLPDIGRVSYQIEQQLDPQVRAEFMEALRQVRSERMRIAELEDVAAYQQKQHEASRQNNIKSLYQQLPEAELADKKLIEKDPAAYLKGINDAMDDWRGRTATLEPIKHQLDQYLTLYPDSSDGYLALAIYYSLQSAFDRSKNLLNALQLCRHVAGIDDANPDLYVIEAGIQLRWDDYPTAQKHLDKAAERDADSFWFHYFTAEIMIREGGGQAAEAKLKALLSDDLRPSKQAYVYSRLATLKLAQGKVEESLSLHEKAVQLHPDFHWRHGNYGFSLLRVAGDIANAEQQLAAATAIAHYGQLRRLALDIQFVKWANALTGNMNPAWAPELATFDPSEKQMGEMMSRVGLFSHGPTVDRLARALMKKGISIDSQNGAGYTAMHRAAREGHVQTLDSLYRLGASLEITEQAGETPLLMALGKRRMKAVDHLIGLGANVKHEATLTGATPLTKAIMGGHHELVKRLLAMGVNPNHRVKGDMGETEETPLVIAVLSGDQAMVKILLDAGADKSVSYMGRTLPQAARELGHEQVLVLLKG